MRTTFMAIGRVYAALRGGLALFGATVLAAFFALPLKTHESLPLFFALAGESLVQSTSAGTIHARDDVPLEGEQRAVTEMIARRYHVSEVAVAGLFFFSPSRRQRTRFEVDLGHLP